MPAVRWGVEATKEATLCLAGRVTEQGRLTVVLFASDVLVHLDGMAVWSETEHPSVRWSVGFVDNRRWKLLIYARRDIGWCDGGEVQTVTFPPVMFKAPFSKPIEISIGQATNKLVGDTGSARSEVLRHTSILGPALYCMLSSARFRGRLLDQCNLHRL